MDEGSFASLLYFFSLAFFFFGFHISKTLETIGVAQGLIFQVELQKCDCMWERKLFKREL